MAEKTDKQPEWTRLPCNHLIKESDEDRLARINRATKRIAIRLIDDAWDVEFDVRKGQMPITPREFGFILQALRLRHRHMLRANSLTQRMERREAIPISKHVPPTPGATVQQNDDLVLKTL
jgi:hypothetical protein